LLIFKGLVHNKEMEGLLTTIIDNDALSLILAVSGFFLCLIALMIYQFFYEGESTSGLDRRESLRAKNNRALSGSSTALSSGEEEEALSEANIEIIQKQEELQSLSEQIKVLQQEKDAVVVTSEGGADVDPNLIAELEEKIKKLQDRLDEYAVIEDDIADLSLLKQQNKDLQDQLAQLQKNSSSPASEDPTIEASDVTEQSAEAPVEQEATSLVDEFEKIAGLSNETEEPAATVSDLAAEKNKEADEQEEDYGSIMEIKLKEMGIQPDSKGEAEMLIGDLKSIRLGKVKDAG